MTILISLAILTLTGFVLVSLDRGPWCFLGRMALALYRLSMRMQARNEAYAAGLREEWRREVRG
jgi:hypothetical protein